MKRLLALLSIVTLLGAACAEEEPEPEEESPVTQAAEVLPIQVDGTSEARNVAFITFFPKEVSARPGDTVRFKQSFTGEPHTVTLGTLVDEGLAASDKAEPMGPEPPEMEKVVDVFGRAPSFGPLNQSAGQPCFLDSGEPGRGDNACPKRDQPDFNGRQTWYNSGFITGESTFDVKLADDIQAGTYRFICVIHRAPMSGKVNVVAKDASRPNAAAVQKKGRDELAKAIQDFKPALDQASAATPDKAQAGALSEKVPTGMGLNFSPRDASIPVGGSLSWTVLSFHTISFNPPGDAFGILIKGADGTIQLNQKLGAPSKARPAPVLFPPTPDLKATTFDAGQWNGEGFFNSGLVVSFPPAVLTYKLTFTNPGTYELRCLVHPDMRGQVKVG